VPQVLDAMRDKEDCQRCSVFLGGSGSVGLMRGRRLRTDSMVTIKGGEEQGRNHDDQSGDQSKRHGALTG
jgi:hypothetical protein